MTDVSHITLRQLYTAHALTGLAAIYVEAAKAIDPGYVGIPAKIEAKIITGIAQTAHKIADAMMKEESGK